MAQTCATDCLHIIFSFLPSLDDVASCALACRRWATAAAAATGRHQTTITSMYDLRALAESPLRCLVGAVDIFSTPLLMVDRVESLWSAFPHLTALTCTIDARQLGDETTLRLPTSLHTLDVTLVNGDEGRPSPWPPLDVLLSLSVRCPLTRLRVSMPTGPDSPPRSDQVPPVGTIQRLLAVSDTLTDLELDMGRFEWPSAHIDVFRSLTHLTRLHVSDGSWSSQELARLTAEPMPFYQLRSVDLEHTLDVGSLARLPSLTQLSHPRNGDLALFSRLPHLATLHLHDVPRFSDTIQFGPALATITDLTMTCIDWTPPGDPEWVIKCIAGMSQLRTLRLFSIPAHLAGLAAIPRLADTLEHIEIYVERSVHVHALTALRSLPRLRSIRFHIVGTTSDSNELAKEDEETVFLPLLATLHLALFAPIGDRRVDLSRLLGRLPALRTLDLDLIAGWHRPPVMPQWTGVSSFKLKRGSMKSAHLARVMSSLPNLRELDLDSSDGDLSFLSSSARLAHTLERLTLNDWSWSVHPRQLLHLRSLTSLRYLNLAVSFAPPRGRIARVVQAILGRFSKYASETSDCIAASSADAALPLVFASLRELRLRFIWLASEKPPVAPFVDLATIFGRMPQLRSATIVDESVMQLQSIRDALAHSTRLAQLTVKCNDLTCAHLVSILRPLAHLRESLRSLVVESTSLDGLEFVADLTNLEHLTARVRRSATRQPLESQLDHLRALTQLRTLDLGLNFPLSSADHPHLHRIISPQRHDA